MSNVEHPKHYQLSIDLEVLDIIKIIMTDGHLNAYQGFIIGNVIKYLFRADKKNGLEDYKKALYYLKRFKSNTEHLSYFSEATNFVLSKVVENFDNLALRNIIKNVARLNFKKSKELLEKYVTEMESKQNEI